MVRPSFAIALLWLVCCVATEETSSPEKKTQESTHEEEIRLPVAGGAKVVVPVKNEEVEDSKLPDNLPVKVSTELGVAMIANIPTRFRSLIRGLDLFGTTHCSAIHLDSVLVYIICV